MTRLIVATTRAGAGRAGLLGHELGAEVLVPERFLADAGADAQPWTGSLRDTVGARWADATGFVFFLAAGAVVRLIAPYLTNKRYDPAVVVVDEGGRFAVSLLSGHAGGGNRLAEEVSLVLGAQPVLTTASDALGLPALDLLGREWGWRIEAAPADLTRASAALVNGEPMAVYQDAGEEGWWPLDPPDHLRRYPDLASLVAGDWAAALVISDRQLPLPLREPVIVYRPPTLVAGIGCVRGATFQELTSLLEQALAAAGLARGSLTALATIDRKRDEAGLLELAAALGVPIRYFSAKELRDVAGPSPSSAAVAAAVGAPGVCEPAALLAAGALALLVPKTKTDRATVAVARRPRRASPAGSLAIVGLGPGGPNDLTYRARRALVDAEVVIGYEGYLAGLRPWLGPKTYRGSPIGAEVERAVASIALARQGRRVALVSNGDAGIYGIASPALERLAAESLPPPVPTVEVIPGITAAQAAAGLLGAPLANDFAVLSLSDLLTPWPLIEQRLEAVGLADLVVALYNPASGRRQTQLPRAREILLRHRGEATPVGVVRDAGRPGQTVVLTDLGHLLATPIDMHTVVLVGNRTTLVQGGRMITPRGYPPPETADQPRKDAPMTLVDGEDGSLEPLRAAASQWKGIGS